MDACLVHDMVRIAAERFPDRIALIEGTRTCSYAELDRESSRLAGWLREDAGVRRWDRVGLHMTKSIQEVVVMMAILRAGAVVVNLNEKWTADQAEHVHQDCELSALFLDRRRLADYRRRGKTSLVRHLVVVESDNTEEAVPWSHVMRDREWSDGLVADTDLAAILYTSGSTGSPKGVMVTHANVLSGARCVTSYLGNSARDIILSVLPFSFDYGLNQLMGSCLLGGTLVLQKVAMASEIARVVQEAGCTGLALVPPAWVDLVDFLMDSDLSLPGLRYVTNSGGKIPERILERMPTAFPNAEIFLMYGLTEAFRSTWLPPALFSRKRGSMGKAVPGQEVFVVDAQERLLGPGETGELVHRGSFVSRGYWNKPEETSRRIRTCEGLKPFVGDEPVVFSGDLVRMDEDGFLWFVSRSDSMIKSSGFRISPSEVEDVLLSSGLLTDAVVFGAADERLGQAICAVIHDRGGRPILTDQLQNHCMKRLPPYMTPQQLFVHSDTLPRTANGKIDRPSLISWAMKLIADPHNS